MHIAADIGCHSFASFAPFSSGHTILGYGMSLASRAGVSPMMRRRTLAIMGDGGFWHNGLLSGVQSALFNGDDAVLVIMKNGYTSATGTQEIISTPDDEQGARAGQAESLVHTNVAIERTLRASACDGCASSTAIASTRCGATLRGSVHHRLRRAQGDHRRGRVPARAPAARQAVDAPGSLEAGKRTVRVKYGVDEDTCSGDHSCIRLSGCPTLSVKDERRPAEGRSGRDGARRLRRLRPVRRERARGDALPVVLSRRGHPPSELARSLRRAAAAVGDSRSPAGVPGCAVLDARACDRLRDRPISDRARSAARAAACSPSGS